MVEFAGHHPRALRREADLLLVVPTLRELAGGVKPVEGAIFPGPTYGEGRWSEGIQRFVELREFLRRFLDTREERVRAQVPISGHSLAVEAIHERDEVFRRRPWPAVPNDHEFAKRSVEQVGGDVADFPPRGDSLQVPFPRLQRRQKLDELFVDSSEQMRAEDRAGHFLRVRAAEAALSNSASMFALFIRARRNSSFSMNLPSAASIFAVLVAKIS